MSYTQEDYARALLRSAISTQNRKLENILTNLLDGATLKKDSNGLFKVVDCQTYNGNKINPYNRTMKALNDAFFHNSLMEHSADIVRQFYNFTTVPGGGHISKLLKEEGSDEQFLFIDPLIKNLLTDFYYEQEEDAKKILEHYEAGKISEEEKNRLFGEVYSRKIKGSDYRDVFARYVYDEKELDTIETFIDIMNQKDSTFKTVNYLDVYSMYHYYIFRKSINNRFLDYLIEHPHLDGTTRREVFKRVVNEQVQNHCRNLPTLQNGFFNKTFMGLSPTKMTTEFAKKLTLELSKATPFSLEMLADYIEQSIKASSSTQKIVIKEIEINPEKYKSDSVFYKKGKPQLFVNIRSGARKIVKDLNLEEKTKFVIVEEDLNPALPQTKPKIIEDSSKTPTKLTPVASVLRKKEEQEKRKSKLQQYEALHRDEVQLPIPGIQNIGRIENSTPVK